MTLELRARTSAWQFLFWPGIIVNEARAVKNQESIDDRIEHLSGIYNGKCLK